MNFILMLFFTTLLPVFLAYLRYKYTYWEVRGFQQFNSFFTIKTLHLTQLLHAVYCEFKGKTKIAGSYVCTKPIAILLSADLINDFNKILECSEFHKKANHWSTRNIPQLEAVKWRSLYTKFLAEFTPNKMQLIFPSVLKMTTEFKVALNEQLKASKDDVIDLHEIWARFSTDFIGMCAFGIECNTLKNTNDQFHLKVHQKFIEHLFIKILKCLGLKRIPTTTNDFMKPIVSNIITTQEQQNIQYKDFMNLLGELQNSQEFDDMLNLTNEEIITQVFIRFMSEFETIFSNMSYAIFELAKNLEMQQKLRNEIQQILKAHDGILSYDSVMTMPYLEQVITETLRKYPPLVGLTRITTQDYQIPGMAVTLEKGTQVYIPIKEISHDPDIFENPQEFHPERFDAVALRDRCINASLDFADDSSMCLSFGRMQARIGLITLLRSFKFSLAANRTNELEISEHGLVLLPRTGVWLKAEKLWNKKKGFQTNVEDFAKAFKYS